MIIGFTGYAGSGKDTTAEILKSELGEHGIKVKLEAFAWPLKTFVSRVFEFNHTDLNDSKAKETRHRLKFNEKALRRRFESSFRDIMLTFISRESDTTDFGDRFSELTRGRDVNEMFDVLLTALDTECKIRKSLLCGRHVEFDTTPRRILQLVGTEFFRNQITDSFWVKIAPTENVIFTDVRFPQEYDHIKAHGGVIIRVINERHETTTDNTGHESERNCGSLLPDHIVVNDGKSLENLTVAVKKLVAELTQIKECLQA